MLRAQPTTMTAEELVELLCSQIRQHWSTQGGPSQRLLYNHMTKEVQVVSS